MSHDNQDKREGIEPIESLRERQDRLADDVDAILDEIDEVPEENAEEFVRSYVQKGGQGESFRLTMEMLAVMAAQGIPQGLAYEGFKLAIGRIIQLFRRQTGESTPSPLTDDPDYDPHTEAMVLEAYNTAKRILEERELQHTGAEEDTFKSVAIAMSMESQLGLVCIGPERYKRLAHAAKAKEFDPSELVKQIIDKWLKQQESKSRRNRS